MRHARRPADGAMGGLEKAGTIGRDRGDYVIQHHHDIRADLILQLNAFLGRQQHHGAIDGGFERHALFGH